MVRVFIDAASSLNGLFLATTDAAETAGGDESHRETPAGGKVPGSFQDHVVRQWRLRQ